MKRAEEILALRRWSEKNFPDQTNQDDKSVSITDGLVLIDPINNIYINDDGDRFQISDYKGAKRLVRLLSPSEIEQIENSWPKS